MLLFLAGFGGGIVVMYLYVHGIQAILQWLVHIAETIAHAAVNWLRIVGASGRAIYDSFATVNKEHGIKGVTTMIVLWFIIHGSVNQLLALGRYLLTSEETAPLMPVVAIAGVSLLIPVGAAYEALSSTTASKPAHHSPDMRK